jgi:hypothetical protein
MRGTEKTWIARLRNGSPTLWFSCVEMILAARWTSARPPLVERSSSVICHPRKVIMKIRLAFPVLSAIALAPSNLVALRVDQQSDGGHALASKVKKTVNARSSFPH